MKLVFLLLLLAWWSCISTSKPPNILFILADDLGYGDLGSFPTWSEHGKISTPNLDALALESMMFTDAYAGAPVCAPSRCALMTGRHSGHCTVRQNGQILNETDVTVANVLEIAGYRNGLVGKWGLGPSENVSTSTSEPLSKGFNFFYGYISQENAHNYYPFQLWRNREMVFIEENQNASVANCGYPYSEHCVWVEDLLVSEGLKFIENATKDSSPFYLFVSFTTPHAGSVGSDLETGVPAPYEPDEYAKQPWPKVERDFASTITLQDQHVGVILKALDDLGVANNTVVFYASDNGAHNEGGHNYHFFESSGPMRGYKRSLHEGGVRTPLLVRWPGVTPGGTVSAQQWGFWDFMCTAADIAGVPESSLPPNDGYSLVPTLQGKDQDQPKYIYHEYCFPNEDPLGWGQAVRFQNWKAVRYDFSEHVELYNLENDLGELMDVSQFFPAVVKTAESFMNEAHVPGPYCGEKPPDPNLD